MPTRSEQNDLDLDLLQSGIEELKNYVITAAGEGVAAHEVEQGLWQVDPGSLWDPRRSED